MTDTIHKMKQALQALHPVKLVIHDDSALHAGHRGHSGGGHYTLLIVSQDFEGLPTIKRHRMVFEAVDHLMTTEIHALSIQARTPAEIDH